MKDLKHLQLHDTNTKDMTNRVRNNTKYHPGIGEDINGCVQPLAMSKKPFKMILSWPRSERCKYEG